MNFLRQANSAIKSAKELEKNLASVGITKNSFTGKKPEFNLCNLSNPASQFNPSSLFSLSNLHLLNPIRLHLMAQHPTHLLLHPMDSPPAAPYAPPPVMSDVPPQIRQYYEVRKPEFEAKLAELKELLWAAALDAAAKSTHADHQAAKTASPDYVLDALVRLQDYVKNFEK